MNQACNQPLRTTQPGHHFVGRHNEYQPKGRDALQLGNAGMVRVWVAVKTVIPLSHTGHGNICMYCGPYLSVLEIYRNEALA